MYESMQNLFLIPLSLHILVNKVQLVAVREPLQHFINVIDNRENEEKKKKEEEKKQKEKKKKEQKKLDEDVLEDEYDDYDEKYYR